MRTECGAGGHADARPLLHVRDIPIDQVSVVEPRRRALKDKAVVALVASIERSGLLTPIAVRIREDVQSPGAEAADPAYDLVAGLHRLEACRKLGWRDISAIVCESSRLEDPIQRHAGFRSSPAFGDFLPSHPSRLFGHLEHVN